MKGREGGIKALSFHSLVIIFILLMIMARTSEAVYGGNIKGALCGLQYMVHEYRFLARTVVLRFMTLFFFF